MNVCLGTPIKKVFSHPELEEGEIFLTNVVKPGGIYLPGINNIKNKTKRLGKIAYDEDGNEIPGMSPVFIKK